MKYAVMNKQGKEEEKYERTIQHLMKNFALGTSENPRIVPWIAPLS